MPTFPTPPNNTRFGLHYFQDTDHYRESDLQAWLPELKALGTSWLTLVTPHTHAIPEHFIRGLVNSGIEPILHFDLTLAKQPQINDLSLLFSSYASWGCHYAILYDKPNSRIVWPVHSWAQIDLIERFLDFLLPAADSALQNGLTPVLPPLEPGGDYWDTAFLRLTLQAIQRRGHNDLLEKIAISAYALPGDRPLNWGRGGPENWPSTRPYYTPQGEENQLGFRIFDWYQAVIQAVLGNSRPIILLKSGSLPTLQGITKEEDTQEVHHTLRNLAIVRRLTGDQIELIPEDPLDPIPATVISCNFWLLATNPNDPNINQAWYKTDGSSLPIVGAVKQWVSEMRKSTLGNNKSVGSQMAGISNHPITHYLLLPAFDWGIADWHLDVIRPFIKKHRPTIGFSLKEAALARRVTVIGSRQQFPESTLDELRSAGCVVQQITEDGTNVASLLSAL